MDGKVLMFVIMGGVFFFGLVAYVVLLIFYPEWVGVHGKKAKEVESSHVQTSDSVTENSQTKIGVAVAERSTKDLK